MSFFGKIFAKIVAAIIRHEQRELEQINALIVRRVDANLTEIKRTRIHSAHPRPCFAAIFGTKNSAALTAQIVRRTDSAFIALHDRHDNFWIAGANCQTNAASLSGKTAAEFFPACATVSALENSADVFAPGHARARK